MDSVPVSTEAETVSERLGRLERQVRELVEAPQRAALRGLLFSRQYELSGGDTILGGTQSMLLADLSAKFPDVVEKFHAVRGSA